MALIHLVIIVVAFEEAALVPAVGISTHAVFSGVEMVKLVQNQSTEKV